jgi:hypothetical protein
MSPRQDKVRDRKRIFRPRSWGVFGRCLGYRLANRAGNRFTIARAGGSRILVIWLFQAWSSVSKCG